jgi:alpha-methylacyl-CoA racemase
MVASAQSPRQTNLLDGGAPFYSVYACADGQYIAVGCLEQRFFRTFLDGFLRGVPRAWLACETWVPDVAVQTRQEAWPALGDFLARGFRQRTRAEWEAVFYGEYVLSPDTQGVQRS